MKNLDTENCKKLKTQINGQLSHVHGLEEHCQNVHSTQAIYRFNAMSIKIPMAFFTEIENNNPKMYMKPRKTPNSQSNLEKEEQNWRHQASIFKLYYKATVIKSMVQASKETQINRKERKSKKKKESPKINPCIYGQLTYDKGAKTIKWGKDSLFNKWYWGNWTATCKRIKLRHHLIPYMKVNSKQIKNLKP